MLRKRRERNAFLEGVAYLFDPFGIKPRYRVKQDRARFINSDEEAIRQDFVRIYKDLEIAAEQFAEKESLMTPKEIRKMHIPDSNAFSEGGSHRLACQPLVQAVSRVAQHQGKQNEGETDDSLINADTVRVIVQNLEQQRKYGRHSAV